MKHFTIVGNWKMHQRPEEAAKLTDRLQKKLKPHTHVTVVVCPPFVSLPAVTDVAEGDVIRVGAQDLHDQDEGAFTGDVSGPMLKGLAEYVIVGHSERRRYHFEKDELIARKLAAAVRNGLKPILCVGENLTERHSNLSSRVVNDQLHACLGQLSADDLKDLKIAYEPVWAIGTGEFAKPEQVEEIVRLIRKTLEELYGESASSQVEVLYGGSVDPDNARPYLEIDNVGGLLVGGASLNYEKFAAIVETAGEIAG